MWWTTSVVYGSNLEIVGLEPGTFQLQVVGTLGQTESSLTNVGVSNAAL